MLSAANLPAQPLYFLPPAILLPAHGTLPPLPPFLLFLRDSLFPFLFRAILPSPHLLGLLLLVDLSVLCVDFRLDAPPRLASRDHNSKLKLPRHNALGAIKSAVAMCPPVRGIPPFVFPGRRRFHAAWALVCHHGHCGGRDREMAHGGAGKRKREEANVDEETRWCT